MRDRDTHDPRAAWLDRALEEANRVSFEETETRLMQAWVQSIPETTFADEDERRLVEAVNAIHDRYPDSSDPRHKQAMQAFFEPERQRKEAESSAYWSAIKAATDEITQRYPAGPLREQRLEEFWQAEREHTAARYKALHPPPAAIVNAPPDNEAEAWAQYVVTDCPEDYIVSASGHRRRKWNTGYHARYDQVLDYLHDRYAHGIFEQTPDGSLAPTSRAAPYRVTLDAFHAALTRAKRRHELLAPIAPLLRVVNRARAACHL